MDFYFLIWKMEIITESASQSCCKDCTSKSMTYSRPLINTIDIPHVSAPPPLLFDYAILETPNTLILGCPFSCKAVWSNGTCLDWCGVLVWNLTGTLTLSVCDFLLISFPLWLSVSSSVTALFNGNIMQDT